MFVARVGPLNMPVEGDTISVFKTGTATLENIVNLAGGAMANPFTVAADATGQWAFVPATTDRLDVYWTEQTKNLLTNVQLAAYSGATPEPLGVATAGVAAAASRSDHVHLLPTSIAAKAIAPATNTANYIPQWDGADSKTLKDGINPASIAAKAIAPATNTANYIPQWDGADSKTLKDGINPATLALLAAPAFTGAMTYQRAASTISALGNMGAAKTVDYAAITHCTGTLDQDCAITISNIANGASVTLTLYSDGTARTISWTGVGVWLNEVPLLGPATGKILQVNLFNDGTTIIAGSGMSV